MGSLASYGSLVLVFEALLSIRASRREVFVVDDCFTCTTLGLNALFVLYSDAGLQRDVVLTPGP